MNTANDSPNYLKSNNRYVSSNKQVLSPQGVWSHWIIIRQRGRADTYFCGCGSLCAFPSIVPSACAQVECHFHPHPGSGEGCFPAHSRSHHQILLSSILRNVRQLGSSFRSLSGRVVLSGALSIPWEMEAEAHYYYPFNGFEVYNKTGSRCGGWGSMRGHWCVKAIWSLENNMVVPQKLNVELLCDPAIPLLGICPPKGWRQQKQPKCPTGK